LTTSFAPLAWEAARAAELVEALARRSGIETRARAPRRGRSIKDDLRVGREIAAAADALGLETDSTIVLGHQAGEQLGEIAPAVIEVPGFGCLGLIGASRGRARLLSESRAVRTVRLKDLSDWLARERGRSSSAEIDEIIRECGIRDGRKKTARQALTRAWTGEQQVATAWSLREHAGLDFGRQLRDAGLIGRLGTMAAAHAAEYVAWLVSWWVLGRGALSGRLDEGWLAAWALLLATLVPLRWVGVWSRGVFATGLGGLLKQRLFTGAVRLDPEVVRREGAGGLLGRVVESDTVETLALNGGMASVLAAVELMIAGAVLALGAGGLAQTGLLVCWTAFAALLTIRYGRKRSTWTAHRLELTHHLVESMSGHRTRLAQQPAEEWHDAEDAALARYVELSRALDRDGARLATLVSRGWPLVGLAGIAATFLAPGGSATTLAIGLGGILLAQRALKRLTAGLAQLAGAWIAWRQVAPIFRAAASRPAPGISVPDDADDAGEVVLDARAVGFRYAGRAEPALHGVDLEIRRGDRLLLEGESGAGKSSLVGVLAGWRSPTTGSILAGGYDRLVLGDDAWRSRVVAAPQYHENHLVSAPLAFNLLMGRRWPALPDDLAEAALVCRGLGLGPLLDRMPGGLQQVVGETGWQLSQGERGRVFLARALLQRADVVILDESFAALDPESLQQAIRFSADYATTLMVVAHR